MRLHTLVAVLMIAAPIVGCATSTAPALSAGPGAPSSGNTVRFATANEGLVRLWRTTPAGVALERTVDIPGWPIGLAWLDARTVVVRNSEGEIGRIVDGRYEPYPPVPEDFWFAPKPQLDPELDSDALFEPEDSKDLVVTHGEVWLSRCLWTSGPYKEECELLRAVRVYPSFVVADFPPATDPIPDPPSVPGPNGNTLSKHAWPVDEGMDPATSVRCAAPGMGPDQGVVPLALTGPAPAGFPELGSLEDEPRWVRAAPPRFIATMAGPDPISRNHLVVFEGCPAASGRLVRAHRVGSNGIWAWQGIAVTGGEPWHIEGPIRETPPFDDVLLEFAPAQ